LILAAKDERTFNAYEPIELLGKGKLHVAGYFQQMQDKNYIFINLDIQQERPYEIIYHEYTHFQFRKYAQSIPVWLNEGIAQFFQSTEINKKDVFIGKANVNQLSFLRNSKRIPLDILFRVDQSSSYYHEEDKGSLFYAESWALTHDLQMLDIVQRTNHIPDYMQLISHNEDPVLAAEKCFGDLKKLQKQLDEYIDQSAFKVIHLSSAVAPIDESSFKAKSLSPNEAAMLQAELLTSIRRYADARKLLDTILLQDSTNVQAYERLGNLELASSSPDAARNAYAKAIELGSQNYHVQLNYATMMMEKELSKESITKIELALRSVIQLHPGDSSIYDLLARLIVRSGNDIEEAYKMERKAGELSPTNLFYRINESNILLMMNNPDQAKTVLEGGMKLAANSNDSAMISSAIARIDEQLATRAKMKAEQEQVSRIEDDYHRALKAQQVALAPKHPPEPLTGPKYSIDGVIRAVRCSYPTVMDMHVETAKKTYTLYSNSYTKIDFSVLGFTATDKLDPCSTMVGLRTRVRYTESSDKSVDGQIVSILLKK